MKYWPSMYSNFEPQKPKIDQSQSLDSILKDSMIVNEIIVIYYNDLDSLGNDIVRL